MKKTIKIIGSAIAAFFMLLVIQAVKDFFCQMSKEDLKKIKKVKKYKKQANKERKRAGVSYDKAISGKKKRRNNRNKHSKVISILLLIFLLPCFLNARYIVWDPEDQVNRDYGNITNYVKSLENDQLIFLATEGYLFQTVKHYSNAYVAMSNASSLQGEVIEAGKPSFLKKLWCKYGFWIGLIAGLAGGAYVGQAAAH